MKKSLILLILNFLFSNYCEAQPKNEVGIDFNPNVSFFSVGGVKKNNNFDTLIIRKKNFKVGAGINLYDKVTLSKIVALNFGLGLTYFNNGINLQVKHYYSEHDLYAKLNIIFIKPEIGLNLYFTEDNNSKGRPYFQFNLSPSFYLLDTCLCREVSIDSSSDLSSPNYIGLNISYKNENISLNHKNTINWQMSCGIGYQTRRNWNPPIHFLLLFNYSLNSYMKYSNQVGTLNYNIYPLRVTAILLRVGFPF